MLLTLSMWLTILPFSLVSHFIELVEEFSLSIENSILELTTVVRSVWVDMESMAVGLSVKEISFQICAV